MLRRTGAVVWTEGRTWGWREIQIERERLRDGRVIMKINRSKSELEFFSQKGTVQEGGRGARQHVALHRTELCGGL